MLLLPDSPATLAFIELLAAEAERQAREDAGKRQKQKPALSTRASNKRG